MSQQQTVEFEDFVKVANFFFATVGIEPYRKFNGKPQSWTIYIVFIVSFIHMNMHLLGEIIFVCLAIYNRKNFVEATMTMSYIGFVIVGTFKMLWILWKRPMTTRLMQELFAIFPKTSIQQDDYKLRSYLRNCSRIVKGFSSLYMLLIWTYNLFILLQYLIYDRLLHLREVGQVLPYFMYIPWDWHDNWLYYLTYALQNIAGYSAAVGTMVNDLLLSGTAIQIIMHYDYVANRIESYVPKGSKPGATEQDKQNDMKFLADMIEYHEKVLSLSDIMNDVFGVPLLFNFASSTFVICFVGFQMSIGALMDTIIKLLLFLVSCLTQIYLICYFAQRLIDSSRSVARAAYNQNWHNADIRYKKMLVLITVRAQKPAMLQATSFIRISLGTMTDIIQLAYKFFALLRTMYSK